jgi:15-cis-phytoene desaturase
MLKRAPLKPGGFFDGVEPETVEVNVENRRWRFELPQRYYDWSFMMAHFPASARKVRQLLPSEKLEPVLLVPGIAIVSMAAFQYRDMATLAPYNELAIMVPVRRQPAVNIPAVPLLFPQWFRDLGFYVRHLPVTTQEARDVGVAVWGFPKIVSDITFDEADGTRRCRWRHQGQDVLTLNVRVRETTPRDMDFIAYTVKDRFLLRTLVQTRGEYAQGRFRRGASYTLGDHPIAAELRELGIWGVAVEWLYVPRAQSLLHRGSERLPASTKNRKVVILGGGVAGMSAAHELVERGFDVSVYETREVPGGKARSFGAVHAGNGLNAALPAEHGFRFFPGFYRHITDTMKHIPYETGTVYDNLVPTTRIQICRYGKRPMVTLARFPRSWTEIKILYNVLFRSNFGLSQDDIRFYMERLWQILTSCKERRFAEYEQVGWWQYIGANSRSRAYAHVLAEGLTRTLVAARARKMNTRTAGVILLQLIFDLIRPGLTTDRVLNGPTNEVWIDPWRAALRSKGVVYHLDAEVESLQCEDGVIKSVTVVEAGRRFEVAGDYYIAAVPVEVMSRLITEEICRIDPQLEGIRELSRSVNLMSGVQFYLKEDVPLEHGHQLYLDTEWALTSISQRQFWSTQDLRHCGDGTARGILSVDISDWETPGSNGKPALKCTDDEVAQEVWRQLKRSLNVEGQEVLRDSNLHSWSVCSDRQEVLFINELRSWDLRPNAFTAIPNFFVAGDYARTNTDLATMEGANEAARRAVNCIIEASGARARPCQTWELREPRIFLLWRWRDRRRYELGLPWRGKLPWILGFAQTAFGMLYEWVNKPAPTDRRES